MPVEHHRGSLLRVRRNYMKFFDSVNAEKKSGRFTQDGVIAPLS